MMNPINYLMQHLRSRTTSDAALAPQGETDDYVISAEFMLIVKDQEEPDTREIPALWRLPGPPDQIARTSEGDYFCSPETNPAVLGWRQLRPDEYDQTVRLPCETNMRSGGAPC